MSTKFLNKCKYEIMLNADYAIVSCACVNSLRTLRLRVLCPLSFAKLNSWLNTFLYFILQIPTSTIDRAVPRTKKVEPNDQYVSAQANSYYLPP